MSAPVLERPAGYGRVLAVPEFRAVFDAHVLSMLGVIVSEIALSVLVYDLTGSPLLSALTFFMAMLTAQSRVESGIHTRLEVALGAVLGAILTTLIFQLLS